MTLSGAGARAAASASDVIVVAAPQAKLQRAVEGAGAALGDACPQILPYPERRPVRAREREEVAA